MSEQSRGMREKYTLVLFHAAPLLRMAQISVGTLAANTAQHEFPLA